MTRDCHPQAWVEMGKQFIVTILEVMTETVENQLWHTCSEYHEVYSNYYKRKFVH